jgi:proteasome assembly chaperone (PAC2) family protein
VDPKGAEAVLRILSTLLKVEVDFSALQDKAQQIDVITSKLKEAEEPQEKRREDLGYIG